MSEFNKTNNKKSNKNNSDHLFSSSRNINKQATKYNQDYKKYSNQLNDKKNWLLCLARSMFNRLLDLNNKTRYITATVIITITIIWLFSGQHNSTSISQELKIALRSDSNSQEVASQPETNTKLDESNTTPSEHISKERQLDFTTKVVEIQKNDNISSIFEKHKINSDDLHQVISNNKINEQLKKIQPGQKLKISYFNDSNKLKEIIYFLDKFTLFVIERDSETQQELTATVKKLNVDEKVSFAKFTITSSLFEDAKKQNLPNNLIFQIINIFTWDIDFAQDLRSGDTVELLYKEYYNKGTPYATGPILAVRFYNNGKNYSAVRYEDNHYADYYTPEGLTLRKEFIRTPVKFTRISSTFSLGRKHPLLHKIRAHRGVDYAAPTGTPIKAAGDGTIIHYERKGGYGKTAIIQHAQKYTTLYAHMSQYNKNLRNGSYVKQGQIIGYVGSTGLATGPHLHYEFRVNGEHKNPLTVPLPKTKPIENKHKIKFIDHANSMMATLDKYTEYADNNFNEYKQLAKGHVNFE